MDEKKSVNERIWAARGILSRNYELCDAAMPHFLEGIRIAGNLADRVYSEASFQIKAIPHCTKEFRETRTWKPE